MLINPLEKSISKASEADWLKIELFILKLLLTIFNESSARLLLKIQLKISTGDW